MSGLHFVSQKGDIFCKEISPCVHFVHLVEMTVCGSNPPFFPCSPIDLEQSEIPIYRVTSFEGGQLATCNFLTLWTLQAGQACNFINFYLQWVVGRKLFIPSFYTKTQYVIKNNKKNIKKLEINADKVIIHMS
jgi:hypothetical protein